GDVGAVELVADEGQLTLVARAGAGEGARDDHLRRHEPRRAARKAGGVRVSGRVEERVRRVDAGVDDADLDTLAGVAGRAGELRRAADLRARVQGRRVAEARVDVVDEAEADER